MAAVQKTKASDRQGVCKRLQTGLKKHYSGRLPKFDLPVLETMLFAACLENSTWEEAEAAHERLHDSFHDLNEIRVSSVKESEAVFKGMSTPDWRALRVRCVLQHVFEETYSFEYETLKRKTLDSANKQLGKVSHMTPFMRLFTLQQCLGSHLLPVDDRMTDCLVWLGMAEPGTPPEAMADILKSAVRKADSALFCHLIRCLAFDPKYAALFKEQRSTPQDLNTAVDRLDRLFKRGASAFRKAKKKVVKKKKTVKRTTAAGKKKKTKPKAAAKTKRKKAGKKTVKVAKPRTTKKTKTKSKKTTSASKRKKAR